MHGITWPHKHGGRSRLGDLAALRDFAFTSVLLNTFNAWRQIISIDIHEHSFQDMCLLLSDPLFEYGSTEHDDITIDK